MDNLRLKKFEKLKRLDEQRLDRIRLIVARKSSELTGLKRDCSEIEMEMERVQGAASQSSHPLVMRETINRVMIHFQKRVNELRDQIMVAEASLQASMAEFREQSTKIKSWEKIVDRSRETARDAETRREFVQADERFLDSRMKEQYR